MTASTTSRFSRSSSNFWPAVNCENMVEYSGRSNMHHKMVICQATEMPHKQLRNQYVLLYDHHYLRAIYVYPMMSTCAHCLLQMFMTSTRHQQKVIQSGNVRVIGILCLKYHRQIICQLEVYTVMHHFTCGLAVL